MLEGLACPNCGSEGPFRIVIECVAIVSDEGIEDYAEAEWNDGSQILCMDCPHLGAIREFTVAVEA